MRIAAIDIGTNSVHMIVVQVRADLSFEVIDREKEMVRLGAGGLGGRALTAEAMTAALHALSKFRRLAESHRVDEILAAATSAVREAENGGEFLAAIEQRTGIRARVISSQEEAQLIHLAAMYGVDTGTQDSVVIDIGGGSVEITLGSTAGARLARSFKLGVIRLTERFVRADPLSRSAERKLVAHVSREVREYLAEIAAAGFGRVIGTSGTILSLGALAWALGNGRPPAEVRNLRVSSKDLHRIRRTILEQDISERLELPGLDPRRADLIVAGAVLFDTILRSLGADEFTLCDLALREGLVLDYIARNRKQIVQVDRYPDVRRRSVVELCERCRYWPEHAHQVARLALALFDQTRAIHGLSDREREWLEYAALMHDLGVHISYPRHHKHSYYLIKNGDLRGFEPGEIEIMALAARYHRSTAPKKSHEGYRDLKGPDRRAVRALAAFLRLAEGLERSHSQIVAKLELHNRQKDYLLTVRVAGDAELELWAAHRHMAPFEELLGKPVYVSVDGHSYENKLTVPHEYPGKLFVVEGIDGSGKTTQLSLLAKWLTAAGQRVFVTEWNSSALVKAATKAGKKKNALTPMTFSLLHATDFADRLLYNIIPPLKAGMIVLADRYAYTAFARDTARGVDRNWVRELYSFAVKPDLALYFKVPIDMSLDRLLARRVKLKFYEAGMDLGLSPNLAESFRIFQGRVLDDYDRIVEEYDMTVIDARASITDQQRMVRRVVAPMLEAAGEPVAAVAVGEE